VHPSKIEAEKGFDAENAAGIPLNASNRNYKDRNHKPEVMVALSEFWLLHGFKSESLIETTLQDVHEFNVLLGLFKSEGYKGLYQFVMEMRQEDVDTILIPLVQREIRRKQNQELSKQDAGWWVCKLYENQEKLINIDRGVFSIYFFNIVKVNIGEAVFQGAGVPHAYLEGQNVELMANSDNVLRGGLTPKHIDVPELMKHTLFQPVIPNVMKGESIGNNETLFHCPVPDFGIKKITLDEKAISHSTSESLEIIILVQGDALVTCQDKAVELKRGDAIMVLPNAHYSITTRSNALLFKAFVP
jgi:mannose-6-phosphate isomerase